MGRAQCNISKFFFLLQQTKRHKTLYVSRIWTIWKTFNPPRRHTWMLAWCPEAAEEQWKKSWHMFMWQQLSVFNHRVDYLPLVEETGSTPLRPLIVKVLIPHCRNIQLQVKDPHWKCYFSRRRQSAKYTSIIISILYFRDSLTSCYFLERFL